MIGLVRLALRRPYTSAIAAMLIVLLGALSVTRMIVDIFPVIDIPVVLVAWAYPGLTTEDMERRVVFISERAYSTTVNGISRIESQSIPGIGLLKVYFQPGTEIGGAIAQISSVNNTAEERCLTRLGDCSPGWRATHQRIPCRPFLGCRQSFGNLHLASAQYGDRQPVPV